MARRRRRWRRRSPDSAECAVEVAGPSPARVADWLEVRLDAVVPDPDRPEHVMLVARWPARPGVRALLVIEVDRPANLAHRLLMHWRDVDAALSPAADDAGMLLLRVRGSHDAVSTRVLSEIACASS